MSESSPPSQTPKIDAPLQKTPPLPTSLAKMVQSSSSPSSQIPKVDAADQNTPPVLNQEPKNPIINGAPDRLMVPKAFKYPERYTSPTDKMMSPVSRGLLARNRKGRKLLPPSVANHSKVQINDGSPFQQTLLF